MNFEEFLKPSEPFDGEEAELEGSVEPDELDVQRTVVEALAAEKAELDEHLVTIREENEELKKTNEGLKKENESLKNEIEDRQKQIEALKGLIDGLKKKGADNAEKVRSAEDNIRKVEGLENTIAELRAALSNVGDVLSINSERQESNQVSLIDRNTEIGDRFPGETRDHVLEVLREARDADEKEGRLRRAQLLESVLVSNEPLGELAKKRAEIERLFSDNGNIINGVVIAGLEKIGISHKEGDKYLLASEIIKRNY